MHLDPDSQQRTPLYPHFGFPSASFCAKTSTPPHSVCQMNQYSGPCSFLIPPCHMVLFPAPPWESITDTYVNGMSYSLLSPVNLIEWPKNQRSDREHAALRFGDVWGRGSGASPYCKSNQSSAKLPQFHRWLSDSCLHVMYYLSCLYMALCLQNRVSPLSLQETGSRMLPLLDTADAQVPYIK